MTTNQTGIQQHLHPSRGQIRALVAATLAAGSLALAGCGSSGTSSPATTTTATTTTQATSTTSASSTSAGSSSPASSATLTTVDPNTASKEQIVAALEANGVTNADKWADEIAEYKEEVGTYTSANLAPTLNKELAKYQPSAEQLQLIISTLKVS